MTRQVATEDLRVRVREDLPDELVGLDATCEGDCDIACAREDPFVRRREHAGENQRRFLAGARCPHREARALEPNVECPGSDQALVQALEIEAVGGLRRPGQAA